MNIYHHAKVIARQLATPEEEATAVDATLAAASEIFREAFDYGMSFDTKADLMPKVLRHVDQQLADLKREVAYNLQHQGSTPDRAPCDLCRKKGRLFFIESLYACGNCYGKLKPLIDRSAQESRQSLKDFLESESGKSLVASMASEVAK